MHVAAHIVVRRCSYVSIHPDTEVGVGQSLSSLIDQHIVVKGHVVDLVVGRERKRLSTDFHANGLPLGFCMNVSLVIEDPVEVAVAV